MGLLFNLSGSGDSDNNFKRTQDKQLSNLESTMSRINTNDRHVEQHDSHGTFKNLDGFIEKAEARDKPKYEQYKRVHLENPSRLDIIHIIYHGANQAPINTSIHQKVLLVIQKSDYGLTCVPFCRHDGDRQAEIGERHWDVVQDNTPADEPRSKTIAFEDSEPLVVSLRGGRKLDDGVTVDMRGFRDVEYDVRVRVQVIGHVPDTDWAGTADRLMVITTSWMIKLKNGGKWPTPPTTVVDDVSTTSTGPTPPLPPKIVRVTKPPNAWVRPSQKKRH